MADFINLFGAIVAVFASMDDYKFYSLIIAIILIALIWKGAEWLHAIRAWQQKSSKD